MQNERYEKLSKINSAIAMLQVAITDAIGEKTDAVKLPSFEEDRMSKPEAMKFAGLKSMMTLNKLIRIGKFKQYSVGHRKFLLKSEMIESLKNQQP